jgi:hypothetical protein
MAEVAGLQASRERATRLFEFTQCVARPLSIVPVVGAARHMLGANWQVDQVRTANADGIERVLVQSNPAKAGTVVSVLVARDRTDSPHCRYLPPFAR